MSTPEFKKEEFLADLRAVYVKHGVWLEACGCCDSPWIQNPGTMYPRPAEKHIDRAIEHLRST